MLDIHSTESQRKPKIHFAHSVLPSYIDPQNVTTRKQPFSTFNKQHFSHSVHLVLPEALWESVRVALGKNLDLVRPQYCRVHMKLSEIIDRTFLQSYIKQGNIMMLSEGRPLVDNCFSLYQGHLRMELDRPTYERCGLQGTAIEDGGKKHQKQRWLLNFDLSSDSMTHGKKGFGRLERACKHVLNHSLTWLFYNFSPSSREALSEGREEICQHAPWIHVFEPNVRKMENVLVPRLIPAELASLYDRDDAQELLEYIHLLHLGSPRVAKDDVIDPHLSRYQVPSWKHELDVSTLLQVTWVGLTAPVFARTLFLTVRDAAFNGRGKGDEAHAGDGEQTGKGETPWFVMSGQAFGGENEWTVMQFASRDTIVWEMNR